jgi:hypothetical protein
MPFQPYHIFAIIFWLDGFLKGLSYEIDFKNVDENWQILALKVPKREIFDRSNFPVFYAIKSSWVCDLVVKILTYYFNFWGS